MRTYYQQLLLILCLLIPMLAQTVLAEAYSSSPVSTGHAELRLISESPAVQPGVPIWLALNVKLSQGWHTYWLNPGDSGVAMEVEWKLPEGFSVGDIQWPYPALLPNPPLMDYGYEGEVTFLARLTVPESILAVKRKKIPVVASVFMVVCRDICIPETANIELKLPVIPATQVANQQNPWSYAFETALNSLPQGVDWGVGVTQSSDSFFLKLPANIEQAHFFPFDEGITPYAAKQSIRDHQLVIPRVQLNSVQLDRLQGVLVLHNPAINKVEAFKVNTPIVVSLALLKEMSIFQAVLYAVIGGVLLNLMPCVFPIIAIKIAGFIRLSQNTNSRPWQHGCAFAVGVVISFALIGLAMLLLRTAGEQIGWGFQLQSPIVVLILICVMFTAGLLFLGVTSVGHDFSNFGSRLLATSSAGEMVGSFLSGVLAVVVATPCTVPFMGPAVGFAITQQFSISLLIFISLGFGMALPYLLLSVYPQWLTLLPKSGPWLGNFKKLLAIPMFGTALWLLWVLSEQLSRDYVLAANLGLLSLSVVIFLHGRKQKLPDIRLKVLVVLTFLSLSFLLLSHKGNSESILSANPSEKYWLEYDKSKLNALRQSGSPVFLIATATWCITCQVNERLVLSRQVVHEALENKSGVFMKADWTNHDPAVTKLLEQFGRVGVPMYVLLPSNSNKKEPIPLPEILTQEIIFDAFSEI